MGNGDLSSEGEISPLLPSRFAQFWENVMAAFRTAGAALIGNSALIYFGFVGLHADRVWIALGMGVIFVAVGCIPITVIERDRTERRKRQAADAEKS